MRQVLGEVSASWLLLKPGLDSQDTTEPRPQRIGQLLQGQTPIEEGLGAVLLRIVEGNPLLQVLSG